MRVSKRKQAVIVAVLLVAMCVLLEFIYRPFVYKNHINDFHFADTFTSWLSVPAAALLFWGISDKRFIKDCLLGSLAGFLLYEFILGQTFDWWDITALLLSGGLTYLAYILYRKIRSHRSQPSKIVSS
jgi:peptidoglycan/LPS O-acetylase OafA/YrhL